MYHKEETNVCNPINVLQDNQKRCLTNSYDNTNKNKRGFIPNYGLIVLLSFTLTND